MSFLHENQQEQQYGSKRRSRLDDFLTNNNADNPDLMLAQAVNHVLCCPACPFMSLLEAELAAHVADCERLAAADKYSSVTVYRCRMCRSASTQLDLMQQHMGIHHGLSGKEEVASQLTASPVNSRPADALGPAPTGSRKRKSHVPERIRSPATSEQSAKFLALDFSDGPKEKVPANSIVQPAASSASSAAPSSVSPASASDILDLSLKAPAADAPGAGEAPPGSQQQIHADPSIPPASSPSSASPKSAACDILDLSMKRLADASSGAEAGSPASKKLPQQRLQKQPQQQKSVAKPQRQNFTDVQNSQLQGWFAEHRDKPYPSTADTHRLAELTGLSYPQVKKWFANRRMRTKTPYSQLTGDGQCLEIPGSDFSSGKASPSNWSLTELRSENSPA